MLIGVLIFSLIKSDLYNDLKNLLLPILLPLSSVKSRCPEFCCHSFLVPSYIYCASSLVLYYSYERFIDAISLHENVGSKRRVCLVTRVARSG